MRSFLFLIAVLPFLYTEVKAQDADIKPLIEAWTTSDTSQTRKYLESAQALKQQPAAVRNVIMQKMHEYLNKHPNPRLQVRVMLFEEPWWAVCVDNDPGGDAGIPLIKKAVQLAVWINDEQLLSDVYSAYAEHCTRISRNEDYVLYSIKALELQDRIGTEHFPYIKARWFDMCKALYATKDYRKSLQFGLQILAGDSENVFTLDLVGACYKKLGLYDSSLFYYKKLAAMLQPDSTGASTPFNEKWLVIANGDIGANLALQKNTTRPCPCCWSMPSKAAG